MELSEFEIPEQDFTHGLHTRFIYKCRFNKTDNSRFHTRRYISKDFVKKTLLKTKSRNHEQPFAKLYFLISIFLNWQIEKAKFFVGTTSKR